MAKKLAKASHRKASSSRIPDSLSANRSVIHKFVRNALINTYAYSTAGAGYGLTFNLGDLPDSADFIALYAEFRITRIDLTFIPSVSQISSTNPAGTGQALRMPNYYVAFDPKSAAAPGGANDVLVKAGMRVVRGIDVCHYTIEPTVLCSLYQGIGQTGYTPKSGTWVDMDDASTLHYGFSLWTDGPGAVLTPYPFIAVYGRYHLECRGSD